MIFRQLGHTGIRLSVIGIGAWAIGGGGYKYGWGSQDDKDSIDTIHRGIDLGINWIDTAPIYGDGHSEEIVGHAVKTMRNKVLISTKCGIHMAENKEDVVFDLKKDSIRKELEASLKRLQTDVIDLYQVHIPHSDEENEYAWRALEDLKKEGKIRFAGVSNFSTDQMKRIQPFHPISFTQPGYNMLEPSIEHFLIDYCRDNHIGIIVFSPMYRGLLTGKITRERVQDFPKDDNRRNLPYYREPFLSANLDLVEKLRPIAERNGKTVAHLAIAWVLRRPEVTSAIVGARKPSQIEETAPAGDWVLSKEDSEELDNLLDSHHQLLKNLAVETASK